MANFTPKQFIKHIRSIANSFIADANDALMDAAIAAEEHFDESFDNEGFNDGGHVEGWTPLAPSTIEGKGHDTILKNTGKLRRSRSKRIMPPSSGGRIARISYSRPYARLQNRGGKNKEGYTVPARKFIGTSRVLNGRIRSILKNRINRLFNKNFSIGR
tara:strand:- start:136 stop:612 length:477 start_codon:yes stop_codon:yes gene_type:complete